MTHRQRQPSACPPLLRRARGVPDAAVATKVLDWNTGARPDLDTGAAWNAGAPDGDGEVLATIALCEGRGVSDV